MSVEWDVEYSEGFKNQWNANVEKCCIYLVGQIRKLINTGQPYVRYVGQKGVYYHGLDPSKPGDPPHKIQGNLQRGYTWRTDKADMSGEVGTTDPVAAHLEFGTQNMAARPHFRRAINENERKMAEILLKDIMPIPRRRRTR